MKLVVYLCVFFGGFSIGVREEEHYGHRLAQKSLDSIRNSREGSDPFHKLSWGHYNSDDAPPADHLNTNWLSKFPDETLVSRMSIPGTHNSGTYNCKIHQMCDFTKCQSWNILDQLKAGIRFLDLRVNTDGNQIMIGHGEFTYISLRRILRQVKLFLDENKSEFVMIAFQKQKGGEDKSPEILSMLVEIGLPYLLSIYVPTYGQLKGRVWILKGYGIKFDNLAYSFFGREGVSEDGFVYMQNVYKVFMWTVDEKKKQMLKTAFRSCEPNRLKANFLSGSYGVFPYWLARTNGGTNEELDLALNNNYKGCLGITVMDFPGTRLIAKIIYSQVEGNLTMEPVKIGGKPIFQHLLTATISLMIIFILL